MRYFKRQWDEDRGDQYADWGPATYYLEVTQDGTPNRQMEVYANGIALRYDQQHPGDTFGMLADQPLDLNDFAAFEIQADEFEQAWNAQKAHNR